MMKHLRKLSAVLPVLLCAAQPAAADSQPNPSDLALTQVVEENEHIAPKGTAVEISAGHMDLGPKIIGGKWELMVRDDSGKTPVWRHPEDVVFRVSDKAQAEIPKKDEYSFINATGRVWVIPQQEIPGVVWLGWNTQSPEVARSVNGGVSLIYAGHQGAGDFHGFVQAGNFSGPQELWNSRRSVSQPIHVEPNTHTHANWVFTKPGEHLLRLSAQARLKDGTSVEDTKILRFAVGDAADAQRVLAMAWTKTNPPATAVKSAQPGILERMTLLPLAVAVFLAAAASAVTAGALYIRRRTLRERRAAEKMAGIDE